MKAALSSTLAILIFGVFTPLFSADEYPADRRWVASPDSRHLLTFTGDDPTLPDAFTIQDASGKMLFSSRDCLELREVLNYEPQHVLWSPDGRAVAFAAGFSKDLRTYILVRSDAVFVLVPAPGIADGFDNPWILPTEWLKGGVMRVKISGPHAGKAGDYGYQGEARLKLTFKPPKCEKTFERVK